jgi:hypothetical protein
LSRISLFAKAAFPRHGAVWWFAIEDNVFHIKPLCSSEFDMFDYQGGASFLSNSVNEFKPRMG